MLTGEDRIRVLKMIEEGKVSAAEGIRLLEQDGTDAQTPTEDNSAAGPRWLRVMVTDTNTKKARVNVRIPVSLMNAGANLGARLTTEVESLNMDQISEMIRAGYIGPVLDVTDDEEDEHVQIFLE